MEISEFEIIRKIRSLKAEIQRKAVVGIGDDAAVLESSKDKLILFTTDTLVEDVHFKWEYITPWQIGWKALAVNASDIAAMGGYPTFFLVTLGIPPKTSSLTIEEIYKGLEKLSSQLNTELIGGDIVRSPIFFITISLLGEVETNKVILRSGAKPGDMVYLTGDIGASAAGLFCLSEKETSIEPSIREFLKIRHLMPMPKVKEGREIAEKDLATSMIDISDGLTSDLHHILEESDVGAKIWADRIPIAEETKRALSKLKKPYLEFALQGGEDYELLFTSSAKDVEENLSFPVTKIGKIIEEKEFFLINERGEKVKLKPTGWDHFRSDFP